MTREARKAMFSPATEQVKLFVERCAPQHHERGSGAQVSARAWRSIDYDRPLPTTALRRNRNPQHTPCGPHEAPQLTADCCTGDIA